MESKYKNLQQLIHKNRAAFDDREPSEGHFDRFAEKLKKNKGKSRYHALYNVLKVAAVIVLIVFSSLYVYEHSFLSEKRQTAQLPSEVREAKMYYSSMVQARYEKIRNFDFEDPQQKKLLLKELKDMDKTYSSLKKDIRSNPNNEHIINAMIMHYQHKVEVLNLIIQRLQAIKDNQLKDNNYEDNEI